MQHVSSVQVPIPERELRLEEGGLDVSKLHNLRLQHIEGNTVVKRHLQRIDIAKFDRVLVLADESEEIDPQMADSRTLATMLLVREMLIVGQQISDREVSSKVLSEILDPRTRHLINLASISNYVMSNDLISSALTQVGLSRYMNKIISELLTADGNEVYLRSIDKYVQEGEKISFWGIVARGRQHQHAVMGYQLFGEVKHVLNPSDKDKKRVWDMRDRLIVLCED